MLSKAEVCRRCQCSKATVEDNLTAAEYNKRGHPLYSEEDVLEFAATRQEKKELRAIEKAARKPIVSATRMTQNTSAGLTLAQNDVD
jgi:hypothetical protein